MTGSLHGAALKARLARAPALGVPGIYDALTALLAQQAGFEAVFLSGGMYAMARYARPDIGLVSPSEIAEAASVIRDRIGDLPMIVDADNGYGNALNVQRTVRTFETAGASALQLEDQSLPKRCGHMAGKAVIPKGEMVGKIKAALDARRHADTLIIARTDACSVEGFDLALERCHAYVEAGADVLFLEGPSEEAMMVEIARHFADRLPLAHNLLEGGVTPVFTLADLDRLRYRLGLFPGTVMFSAIGPIQKALADLLAKGHTLDARPAMYDHKTANALIGTPEMVALGERYAG